ncbi:hypothetical protein IMZ48_38415 [Candidatus Bathyarchaeota archaeon]|nr:hypothetical protein [Candidatus Bathyarchaeota archaeon]
MLPRIPLLLPLALLAAAKFQNDFSTYPSGAQDCLETASDESNCDGKTVDSMNACLCANGGGFLTLAAVCITISSPDDMSDVYSLLKVNCEGSDSHLEYSEDEFIAQGEPLEDENEEHKEGEGEAGIPAHPHAEDGLSTGATAGIAVGATAVGAGLIGLAAFLFLRKRRQARAADESNPMLGAGAAGASSTMASETAYASPFLDNNKSPYHDNKSPAWGPQSVAGETPVQQYHEAPARDSEIYELPSMPSAPVEMQGSEPVHKP